MHEPDSWMRILALTVKRTSRAYLAQKEKLTITSKRTFMKFGIHTFLKDYDLKAFRRICLLYNVHDCFVSYQSSVRKQIFCYQNTILWNEYTLNSYNNKQLVMHNIDHVLQIYNEKIKIITLKVQ